MGMILETTAGENFSLSPTNLEVLRKLRTSLNAEVQGTEGSDILKERFESIKDAPFQALLDELVVESWKLEFSSVCKAYYAAILCGFPFLSENEDTRGKVKIELTGEQIKEAFSWLIMPVKMNFEQKEREEFQAMCWKLEKK
jgi:hypothetical protein